MKARKILTALLSLAPLAALACAGGFPAALSGTPEPTAGRVAPTATPLPTPEPAALTEGMGEPLSLQRLDMPTATPEPTATPPPTATAAPNFLERMLNESVATRNAEYRAGVGICYRTPAVQDWILSRLNRTTCAHTGIAELYRITTGGDFAELKAGDLSGLVNVPYLTVGAHQCGDWADPEYAAGVLAGFNPEARIQIFDNVRSTNPYPEDWPGSVIFDAFLRADSAEEAQRTIGQSVHETEIDRLGVSGMDALKSRAFTLKDKINAHAVAIAEAVRDAQGIDGKVHHEGFGLAVVGKDADDLRDSRIYVQVGFDNRDCVEG